MAASNVAPGNVVVENILQTATIPLKNKKIKIAQAANLQYSDAIRNQGDTVTVQTFPNTFGYMGGTAGGDIVTQGWAIKDEQITADQVFQNGAVVKDIEAIQSNLAVAEKLSGSFAYASSLNDDQFVASFFSKANTANKLNDKSPATISATNAYKIVTALNRTLAQNNAAETRWLFINPEFKQNLKLENIFDASDTGLKARVNGLLGTMDGLRIVETNDLPHVRALTLSTNPTAGQTITVAGVVQNNDVTSPQSGYTASTVTFTFVSAGTAAAAGEISLGANVAATQLNLVLAVNGTGTPSATTYIELALADRKALKNQFTELGAFTTNVASLRTADTTTVAGTATVTVGVDAVLITAVDDSAISMVSQMDKFKVRDLNTGFRENILQEKIFGGKVLDESGKGMATLEAKITAIAAF